MNAPPPSHEILPEGMRTHVPIGPRTTLGVGGTADYFAQPRSVPELQELLAWARRRHLPVTLLGEGSNVIVHDAGLRGLVLRYFDASPAALHGISMQTRGASDACEVTLPGHVPWSSAVLQLAQQGWHGTEALYGIPGSAGAAPVQNIGAYGQDVAQTLRGIDVVDTATSALEQLPARDLGLGYRQSHLRGLWAGRYVVTAVHLTLTRARIRPLEYPSLLQALRARGLSAVHAPPEAVARAVWDVRAARGMVWHPQEDAAQAGTVGSFFTNPIVPAAEAQALLARYPGAPHWPTPNGQAVKLSAAWLIEAAGFARGWTCAEVEHRVGLSPLHALALVNVNHGSALDIEVAATQIYRQVHDRLSVALSAEPVRLGHQANAAPFT